MSAAEIRNRLTCDPLHLVLLVAGALVCGCADMDPNLAQGLAVMGAVSPLATGLSAAQQAAYQAAGVAGQMSYNRNTAITAAQQKGANQNANGLPAPKVVYVKYSGLVEPVACIVGPRGEKIPPWEWQKYDTIRQVSSMKTPDGGKYTGTARISINGAWTAHGTGSFIHATGEKYVGEFKDGNRCGHGTFSTPDGRKYEGGFENGKTHGQGTFTWPDGSKYVGQFRDDMMNGQGTRYSPDGTAVSGEWRDDLPFGTLTVTSTSGTSKALIVADGKPVKATGSDVWPDGTKYVGEWDCAVGKGRGTISWKDGRQYEGEWKVVEDKQDPPDGEGAMSWPDGRKYAGDFRDGKMHGLGKMTYPDGRVEEGVWRDDAFTGTPAQSGTKVDASSKSGSAGFGSVSIVAEDDSFEVFADGSFVGNSPAKLKLSEGIHIIEVKKAGFKDYKREINVPEGAELNLRAVLEKM